MLSLIKRKSKYVIITPIAFLVFCHFDITQNVHYSNSVHFGICGMFKGEIPFKEIQKIKTKFQSEITNLASFHTTCRVLTSSAVYGVYNRCTYILK